MIRMISSALKSLVRLVLVILLTPYKLAKYLARGVMPVSRTSTSWLWWFTRELVMVPVWLIRAFLKEIWTIATTTYRLILRSPRQTYNKFVFYRDWVMVKVEYLQGESNKWKNFFTTLKAPYSLLRAMGFSPQFATSILAAGSIAGGGVAVAEVLEPPSFSRGDSGVYAAPSDNPVEWNETMQTLRVDLGTTPVGLLELDSISINTYAGSALPTNLTNALILGGLPATSDPVFAETYLEVGDLYIDKWRCSKLIMEHIEVNHLILTKNAADGISHSMTAGTPRARGISGGVRANEMVVSNSTYDQVVISSATSNVDGRVDEIRMVNIWAKNPCLLSRIKAGTITINLSEFGNGDGLALKDWTISQSVVYQTLTADQNIEVLISPPS